MIVIQVSYLIAIISSYYSLYFIDASVLFYEVSPYFKMSFNNECAACEATSKWLLREELSRRKVHYHQEQRIQSLQALSDKYCREVYNLRKELLEMKV